MENGVRKNTLKLMFETGAKAPVHMDVLRFIMDKLKLSATDLHSVYKDENDGNFYLKFIDEAAFSGFLNNLEEHYQFQYNDGSTTFVQLATASRIFRYVRIFNLPPEIEEKTIAQALGQYGTIRQHVRERYPMDFQFNVYNGVRGVHMELAKEIPASLFIGHFRARLYYDGLKNRCFHCKQEGHVKSSCPKLVTVSPGSGGPRSYSSVAARGTPVAPPVLEVPAFKPQMQLLNSKRNQSVPTPAPPQVTVPVTEAAISQREKVPADGAALPAVTPATSGSSVAGSSKTPAEILKVLQSIAKETEEPMDTSLDKVAPKRPADPPSDGEGGVSEEGGSEEGGTAEGGDEGLGGSGVDADGFKKQGGKRSNKAKKSKKVIKTIETRADAKASK